MNNKINKPRFFGTREEIIKWLNEYHINNFKINKYLTIDIDDDIIISDKHLKFIPVKFGTVTGNFDCSYTNLTSLVGSPEYVGGHFWCEHNRLTSLVGAPKSVAGGFYCYGNKLISLLEIIKCSFKGDISFNIDEVSFKPKELIEVLKKYYNSKFDYYLLESDEFYNKIKPQIEKKVLQQKLVRSGNKLKLKNKFI